MDGFTAVLESDTPRMAQAPKAGTTYSEISRTPDSPPDYVPALSHP